MDKNFKTYYRKWSIIHSLLNIIGLFITMSTGNIFIWIALVSFSFAYYIYNIPFYDQRIKLIFSYANWVTMFRLMILLGLALSYTKISDISLFVGFLLIISLDGVDGFLARKFNQASKVGEALDMETDSLMVFILCWIHYNSGFDWWILIPGSMRYLSELLTYKLNEVSSLDLPKKLRSTIAVIFFISLLAYFILPLKISDIVLKIGSILVMLSFFSSILLKILDFKSIINLPNEEHASK